MVILNIGFEFCVFICIWEHICFRHFSSHKIEIFDPKENVPRSVNNLRIEDLWSQMVPLHYCIHYMLYLHHSNPIDPLEPCNKQNEGPIQLAFPNVLTFHESGPVCVRKKCLGAFWHHVVDFGSHCNVGAIADTFGCWQVGATTF